MDQTPFKILRFSTDDFPEGKRVDAYCEIYGRTIIRHEIEPIGEEPFRFQSALCSLPGLGLASSVFSPCRRYHGGQLNESDELVLGIGMSGQCIVQQRGREAVIDMGDAVLTAFNDPANVVISSTSSCLSFRVPGSMLRSRIAGLDELVARQIRCDATVLHLLAGYTDAVRDLDVLATPELRNRVVAHIHDLVSLLLGATGEARHAAEQGGVRAARRQAVLRNIERLSADPGLSASAVASLLGITPRYVHLVLEETGKTFGELLLEQRLERAAALLHDPVWRDRKIVEIATEAGFTNLSYFNRSFRRRYGDTPTGARRTRRE